MTTDAQEIAALIRGKLRRRPAYSTPESLGYRVAAQHPKSLYRIGPRRPKAGEEGQYADEFYRLIRQFAGLGEYGEWHTAHLKRGRSRRYVKTSIDYFVEEKIAALGIRQIVYYADVKCIWIEFDTKTRKEVDDARATAQNGDGAPA